MKNNSNIVARYLPERTFQHSGNALLVPCEATEIKAVVSTLMQADLPLVVMFGTDERAAHAAFVIHYVFGLPAIPALHAQADKAGVAGQALFIVPTLLLADTTSFPSLAREFPRLALYEREIMTMLGLKAVRHPDPRSIGMHEENWPAHQYPLRKDFNWNARIPETHAGDYRFNRVGGEGIYEIPVGPIHAGIIEPGHFRFSVAGEEIVALEARMGWVHKGVEKLLENSSTEKQLKIVEHISGDSAFSHSLAFCQALETLSGAKVPRRAQYLRVMFAELERLTMHIFDIGNIAGAGTGFSFMAAQGFRMVEDLRQMSASLSGHRFLRGINTPGGITRDITAVQTAILGNFFSALRRDFTEMISIAKTSASLAGRLKGTGVLPAHVVRDYGAVGIAARCNEVAKDARLEYPYAAYGDLVPEIQLTEAGDVDARFQLRIKEVYESFRLIEQVLTTLPAGHIKVTMPELPAEGLGVGLVEGWRGEIAYVVKLENGAISRVKVRDPSFINWQLLSHLSSTDMVPDFPLINKSFDLSYSGNDL